MMGIAIFIFFFWLKTLLLAKAGLSISPVRGLGRAIGTEADRAVSLRG
jgi:hypothetical protein